MKTQVNWGILSTAYINRRLIPDMHASGRTELMAVASRDLERAEEYAAEWGIPKAYGTYEELIADAEIDVVYIPLPNDLHTEWCVRALDGGKHVLCEKPLCLSLVEIERIKEATRRSGKCVMEAFMYKHHPQTLIFQEIIRKGEIGELIAMHSEFVYNYVRPQENYRMRAEQGGGALWDIGVYPVSFFDLVDHSEIRHVSARAKVVDGIDMSFWGRIDYASGVSAQFLASFETEYSTRTSLLGAQGRLDITHPFNNTDECKAWITRGGLTEEVPLPRTALFACEIENMNNVVLQQAEPLVSLAESERLVNTIRTLREAAGLK